VKRVHGEVRREPVYVCLRGGLSTASCGYSSACQRGAAGSSATKELV